MESSGDDNGEQRVFSSKSESHPMIYAYSDSNPQYKGLLKVGCTEKDVLARVSRAQRRRLFYRP